MWSCGPEPRVLGVGHAARALPDPVLWIPESREMGDAGATDKRAGTDYCEFVVEATHLSYADH